jgi:hypothetical protein
MALRWTTSVAILVSGLAMAGPPAEGARNQLRAALPSGGLLVEPSYWCEDPNDEFPCTTAFTADLSGAWANEDSMASAAVTDLRNGSQVALEFGDMATVSDVGDEARFETAASLPSGRYQVRLVIDTPGKWWCTPLGRGRPTRSIARPPLELSGPAWRGRHVLGFSRPGGSRAAWSAATTH